MNVRIYWVRAMKCMYAQTRPRFILSSEGVQIQLTSNTNCKTSVIITVNLDLRTLIFDLHFPPQTNKTLRKFWKLWSWQQELKGVCETGYCVKYKISSVMLSEYDEMERQAKIDKHAGNQHQQMQSADLSFNKFSNNTTRGRQWH